jgi:hypothetical protein
MTPATGQLSERIVDLVGPTYVPRVERSRLTARLAIRIVLAAGLLGIAVFHLVVIVRNGEPSGLDYGNWLTLGHRWLHDGAPGGSQSTYPPVAPLLVVAAVRIFGPVWGEGLLTSVGALAPALAVGVVLRGRVSRPVVAALVLLIAAGEATGEAAAWGGVPQLLSLATGLIALWRLVLLMRQPSARSAWIVGAWILLTALISHLLLAQVAACALVVLIGHFAIVRTGLSLRGRWTGREGLALLAARVVAPLLPVVALYWRLSQTVGASVVSRSNSSLHTLLVSVSGVFRDAPWAWLPAAILTALTPLLWSRRKDPLWLLVNAILIADVVVTLQTGEARLAYMMPLDVACALGLWSNVLADSELARIKIARIAGQFAFVGVTAAVIVAGLAMFPAQRTYYGDRIIYPGTVTAIDWLRGNTPATALVAVAPTDGLPFGWWVEGLGHRATLTGSSETYLNFPDERERAREAVSLYSLAPDQTALLLEQSARLGVSYLFVPRAWGGATTSAVGTFAAANPSAVVFVNSGAMIIKVSG